MTRYSDWNYEDWMLGDVPDVDTIMELVKTQNKTKKNKKEEKKNDTARGCPSIQKGN